MQVLSLYSNTRFYLPAFRCPVSHGCSEFFEERLSVRAAATSDKVFPSIKTRFCLELTPDFSCTYWWGTPTCRAKNRHNSALACHLPAETLRESSRLPHGAQQSRFLTLVAEYKFEFPYLLIFLSAPGPFHVKFPITDTNN